MKKSLGPRTLAFTTPVWCIGTYDANDKPNVMTIAWGGICCSVPPCVNFSLRKATYTYECVMRHKAFTVNIPSARYAKEADYVCKEGPWHDYSHIVGDDENILVEKCVRCDHVIRFVKSERGRIDSVRYAETHMKFFAQPSHPFYEKYYGRKKEITQKGTNKA